MKILPEDLPNDVEALKALLLEQALLLGKKDSLLSEKDSQLAQWQSKYTFILEQWRLAQQKQFGKSSEISPGQGELFDEIAAESDVIDTETETQIVSYTRQKPKRQPLPKDLSRETVVLDIAESDKVCSCCQGALHCIGEDRSEKLDFIPAQLKVIETVRPKYACRECERTGTQNAIKQAVVPPNIIPKGIATPSILSQIITGKFQYSLPLYRQETLFKQYGIELSRRTMSDWMKKCADALKPPYERLHQELLKQSVIQADKTTLNVIKEARSKCYMWVYCTGKDAPDKYNPIPNIVLYDYQSTRSEQCAVDFYKASMVILMWTATKRMNPPKSRWLVAGPTHVANLSKRKKACRKASQEKQRWRSTTSKNCTLSKRWLNRPIIQKPHLISVRSKLPSTSELQSLA